MTKPLQIACMALGFAAGAGHMRGADPVLAAPSLVIQSGHNSILRRIAFSPVVKPEVLGLDPEKGRRRLVATASNDGPIRIWDIDSGFLLRSFGGRRDGFGNLVWSADGASIISAGPQSVDVFSVATGKRTRSLPIHANGYGDGPGISASGKLVAFESNRKTEIWDLSSGLFIRKLNVSAQKLAFSRDDRMIAVGGPGGRIEDPQDPPFFRVWDVASGTLLCESPADGPYFAGLEFATGGLLVGVSQANRAPRKPLLFTRVWDLNSKRNIATYTQGAWPMAAALSYEHKALLYAWNEETAHGASLWSLGSTKEPKTLPGDILPDTVAFSPDGTLAAGGDTGRVFIWDLKTSRLQRTLLGAAEEPWTVKFSQDGRLLLTGGSRYNWENKGYDQSLRVWNILTGNGPQQPHGAERPFAISPDSRSLVYSAQNSTLNITDLSFVKHQTLLPQKFLGGKVAFDRTGTRLAVSNPNSRDIEIWSLNGPKLLSRLSGHTYFQEELAFSPREDILASASDDGSVGLWNTSSGSLIRFLGERLDPPIAVWSVSFHPDGSMLASAGNDLLIHLWRVPSGEHIAQLANHTRAILGVSFSPDGHRLASAGGDGTVRLWDVAGQRQLRVIEDHEWNVYCVAWHRSGKYFVTGSGDGTARLWTREGNAVATIVTFSNSDDWLVVAPDGLFDGSAQGIRRAMWRVGQSNEVLPLGAFFLDFYHPGLLADFFADEHPKARLDLAMALQFPGLRLLIASNHATFRQAKGNNYVICLNELPGVAVNVAAGDSAIPTERDGFRITRDATCPFQRLLPGTPEQQRLYVSGMQAVATRVVTPWDKEIATDTRQARLHVFTVGVTEYRKNSGFDRLTYAGASAQAIERYFRGAPLRRMPFAAVKVWPGLYDQSATKSGIAAALRALAADAKDEDVVLLYFAGHGQVETGQEMFYFVPSDGNSSRLDATGFSAADMADLLRGLRSHRVVLIVDACQAGASMEALERVANAKAQAELRIGRQEPATMANSHRVGVHLLAATMPLSFAVQIKTDRSALAATLLDYFDRAPNGITAKGLLAHAAEALPGASRSQVGFEQIPLTVTIGQDFPLVNR